MSGIPNLPPPGTPMVPAPSVPAAVPAVAPMAPAPEAPVVAAAPNGVEVPGVVMPVAAAPVAAPVYAPVEAPAAAPEAAPVYAAPVAAAPVAPVAVAPMPVSAAPMPTPAAAPNPMAQFNQVAGAVGGGVAGSADLTPLDQIDMSDVEDRPPYAPVLPTAPYYEGVITAIKNTGAAPSGGTNYYLGIVFTFPEQVVVEGNVLVLKGLAISDNVQIGNDNTRWKLKSLAQACDLYDENLKRIKPGVNIMSFLNRKVRFKVKTEMSNGNPPEPRNKIAGEYLKPLT